MKNPYQLAYDTMFSQQEPPTPKPPTPNPWWFILGVVIFLIVIIFVFWAIGVWAETAELKASWYSVESLKKEGTYKYSKGVMANGQKFRDDEATAACRLFPLGTILRITSSSGKSISVRVTDRIGKRFAKKRIDLSKMAFSQLTKLEAGVIPVRVEVVK